MKSHQTEAVPAIATASARPSKVQHQRKNAFASRSSLTVSSDETGEDSWWLFNDDSRRFEYEKDEEALSYWRRQSKNRLMEPLALVVRDVYGLCASTTSVERLFSSSGFVFGKRRGSLSPRMLVKQTSLMVWRRKGVKGLAIAK
jgi:hypothetical protein